MALLYGLRFGPRQREGRALSGGLINCRDTVHHLFSVRNMFFLNWGWWSLSIPNLAIGPFCGLEWSLLSRRYKGQRTALHNERECPYWVDLPIPEGGLGRNIDRMHDWHSERGLPVRAGSGGLWVARFCFADKANAESFAVAFHRKVTL